MSLMTNEPPRVRISSRTFGSSSESMMCPESSTSSTCECSSAMWSPQLEAIRPAVAVDLPGAVQRAVPKALQDHQLGRARQRALLDAAHGPLDVVRDAFQRALAVLPDGVAGARIAVARQADAARVDDHAPAGIEQVRLVRMPHDG